MIGKLARRGSAFGALVAVLLGTAAPALAQAAPGSPEAEARLRKVEAEVRALQRQVFPGSDGKFFTPEVTQGTTPRVTTGIPASTPVSDLLTRMEAVEAQLSRLTAQNEETSNRVAQLEAKITALAPPPTPAVTPAEPAAPATPPPAPTTTLTPSASLTPPAPLTRPAVTAARPVVAPVRPAVPVRPTPQRVAAVQKIEKPDSGNLADDEYSYGYRLWEAKFYPEAQQQLQLYVSKYPRDPKISYGRNLLGRAFLDDGKPREAGAWFVQNYQADKRGARAADSLLNLADAMRQLKDTSRACIALAEFGEVYAREAASRLKPQYDAARAGLKCD